MSEVFLEKENELPEIVTFAAVDRPVEGRTLLIDTSRAMKVSLYVSNLGTEALDTLDPKGNKTFVEPCPHFGEGQMIMVVFTNVCVVYTDPL